MQGLFEWPRSRSENQKGLRKENLKDVKVQPTASLHLYPMYPTRILGAFFFSTGLGMHDILSDLQIFTERKCLKNLADICVSILVIQSILSIHS